MEFKLCEPDIPTYEEAQEEARKEYEQDKLIPENFSYWYPKIANVQGLLVPKSKVFPMPFELYWAFEYDEMDKYRPDIEKFVNTELIPYMESQKHGIFFCKNGGYSDKFVFHRCTTDKYKILSNLTSICYGAACVRAGGNTEFVLRDYIFFDHSKYATIYEGMPLRCEIRVFYDFDAKHVLYAANYWDYEYIKPHPYDRTDQIVFTAVHGEIDAKFEKYRDIACSKVAEALKDVDMQGRWSVDILIDDRDEANPKFYLIDMARAWRSAYWDESKIA